MKCPNCGSRLKTDMHHVWCPNGDYGKRPKGQPDLYVGDRLGYFIDKKGCWICTTHSKDNDGYPHIKIGKYKTTAARFVYLREKGQIPDGMVVMHSCDNPTCINPAHLSLGTQAENMHDRDTKGRGPVGERNGRFVGKSLAKKCHKAAPLNHD